MSRNRKIAVILLAVIGVLAAWLLLQRGFYKRGQREPPTAKQNAQRASHDSAENEPSEPASHDSAAQKHTEHAHDSQKHTEHTHDSAAAEEEVPLLRLPHRPLNMEGDLHLLYEAYRDIQARTERLKEGKGRLSDINAYIDRLGFNSDWTLFLRLYARRQIGLPMSPREQFFVEYADWGFLARAYKRIYNSDERYDGRVKLSKPVWSTMDWLEKNAPEEYQLLEEYYRAPALDWYDKHAWRSNTMDGYQSLIEDAERNYGFFFTGLSKMPADARVWEVFSQKLADASASSAKKRSRLPTDPVPPPDGGAQSAPPREEPPAQRASPPQAPPQTPPPAEMEAQTRAAMESYGVEERLRQIAEAHPGWAESIARWAEERHRRQQKPIAPPIPPPPPIGAPPHDPHGDRNEEGPPPR